MVSKKSKKKTKKKQHLFFFTFLNWEKQTWYWEKRWLFSIGNGAEIRPLEKDRTSLYMVFILIHLLDYNVYFAYVMLTLHSSTYHFWGAHNLYQANLAKIDNGV